MKKFLNSFMVFVIMLSSLLPLLNFADIAEASEVAGTVSFVTKEGQKSENSNFFVGEDAFVKVTRHQEEATATVKVLSGFTILPEQLTGIEVTADAFLIDWEQVSDKTSVVVALKAGDEGTAELSYLKQDQQTLTALTGGITEKDAEPEKTEEDEKGNQSTETNEQKPEESNNVAENPNNKEEDAMADNQENQLEQDFGNPLMPIAGNDQASISVQKYNPNPETNPDANKLHYSNMEMLYVRIATKSNTQLPDFYMEIKIPKDYFTINDIGSEIQAITETSVREEGDFWIVRIDYDGFGGGAIVRSQLSLAWKGRVLAGSQQINFHQTMYTADNEVIQEQDNFFDVTLPQGKVGIWNSGDSINPIWVTTEADEKTIVADYVDRWYFRVDNLADKRKVKVSIQLDPTDVFNPDNKSDSGWVLEEDNTISTIISQEGRWFSVSYKNQLVTEVKKYKATAYYINDDGTIDESTAFIWDEGSGRHVFGDIKDKPAPKPTPPRAPSPVLIKHEATGEYYDASGNKLTGSPIYYRKDWKEFKSSSTIYVTNPNQDFPDNEMPLTEIGVNYSIMVNPSIRQRASSQLVSYKVACDITGISEASRSVLNQNQLIGVMENEGGQPISEEVIRENIDVFNGVEETLMETETRVYNRIYLRFKQEIMVKNNPAIKAVTLTLNTKSPESEKKRFDDLAQAAVAITWALGYRSTAGVTANKGYWREEQEVIWYVTTPSRVYYTRSIKLIDDKTGKSGNDFYTKRSLTLTDTKGISTNMYDEESKTWKHGLDTLGKIYYLILLPPGGELKEIQSKTAGVQVVNSKPDSLPNYKGSGKTGYLVAFEVDPDNENIKNTGTKQEFNIQFETKLTFNRTTELEKYIGIDTKIAFEKNSFSFDTQEGASSSVYFNDSKADSYDINQNGDTTELVSVSSYTVRLTASEEWLASSVVKEGAKLATEYLADSGDRIPMSMDFINDSPNDVLKDLALLAVLPYQDDVFQTNSESKRNSDYYVGLAKPLETKAGYTIYYSKDTPQTTGENPAYANLKNSTWISQDEMPDDEEELAAFLKTVRMVKVVMNGGTELNTKTTVSFPYEIQIPDLSNQSLTDPLTGEAYATLLDNAKLVTTVAGFSGNDPKSSESSPSTVRIVKYEVKGKIANETEVSVGKASLKDYEITLMKKGSNGNSDQKIATTRTNEQGEYRFADIDGLYVRGDYYVTITPKAVDEEYVKVTQDVKLEPYDSKKTVNFFLRTSVGTFDVTHKGRWKADIIEEKQTAPVGEGHNYHYEGKPIATGVKSLTISKIGEGDPIVIDDPNNIPADKLAKLEALGGAITVNSDWEVSGEYIAGKIQLVYEYDSVKLSVNHQYPNAEEPPTLEKDPVTDGLILNKYIAKSKVKENLKITKATITLTGVAGSVSITDATLEEFNKHKEALEARGITNIWKNPNDGNWQITGTYKEDVVAVLFEYDYLTSEVTVEHSYNGKVAAGDTKTETGKISSSFTPIELKSSKVNSVQFEFKDGESWKLTKAGPDFVLTDKNGNKADDALEKLEDLGITITDAWEITGKYAEKDLKITVDYDMNRQITVEHSYNGTVKEEDSTTKSGEIGSSFTQIELKSTKVNSVQFEFAGGESWKLTKAGPDFVLTDKNGNKADDALEKLEDLGITVTDAWAITGKYAENDLKITVDYDMDRPITVEHSYKGKVDSDKNKTSIKEIGQKFEISASESADQVSNVQFKVSDEPDKLYTLTKVGSEIVLTVTNGKVVETETKDVAKIQEILKKLGIDPISPNDWKITGTYKDQALTITYNYNESKVIVQHESSNGEKPIEDKDQTQTGTIGNQANTIKPTSPDEVSSVEFTLANEPDKLYTLTKDAKGLVLTCKEGAESKKIVGSEAVGSILAKLGIRPSSPEDAEFKGWEFEVTYQDSALTILYKYEKSQVTVQHQKDKVIDKTQTQTQTGTVGKTIHAIKPTSADKVTSVQFEIADQTYTLAKDANGLVLTYKDGAEIDEEKVQEILAKLGVELTSVDNWELAVTYQELALTITYVYSPDPAPEKPTPDPKPTPSPSPTPDYKHVYVKYVDENGKELATSSVLTGEVGGNYQATAKIITCYELIGLSANSDAESGVFGNSTKTVIYTYKKKTGTPEIPVDPTDPTNPTDPVTPANPETPTNPGEVTPTPITPTPENNGNDKADGKGEKNESGAGNAKITGNVGNVTTKNKNNLPKTGEANNTVLWFVGTVCIAVALVFFQKYRGKKM